KKYTSEPTLKDIPKIVFTFAFVVVGWIMFRVESVNMFFDYVAKIFSSPFNALAICEGKYLKVCFFIFVLLAVEWVQRGKDHALQLSGKGVLRFRFVRWCLYYVIFLITITMQGEGQTFIYFQF
ncbi:MAG: MBOAT family protein, partial [Bacteroidota bacterium]|nr:MBOAT family protein [Bacteroidota bacterium]